MEKIPFNGSVVDMNQMKKTKIVATIGPASRDKGTLTKMVEAGLNVVRMNFSHGTHDEHYTTLSLIRKVEKATKKPVAILQDLSGPKIRIGTVPEGTTLKEGQRFVLSTKKGSGDVYVNYKKLHQDVSKGTILKIDDGKITLKVTSVRGSEIHTNVIVGGPLSSNKGVNVPNKELGISSLTAKDKRDVLFGIKHEVDFIALSFVQHAQDVKDLRKILDKHGSKAKIIAKIETTGAIKNLDEILEAADGAMVARGDMAVEASVEKVPRIQKNIIRKCNQIGKPVITATQMLDSMEKNPVPTRAEVSDVANAILDGTDAVMLSSESAIGKYPILSVQMMSDIAHETEPLAKNTHLEYFGESRDIVDTMTVSVVRIANNVRARLIITLTESGLTPQMVARFRPHHTILAVTPHEHTLKHLHLTYGCYPVLTTMNGNVKELSKQVKKLVQKEKLANKGEKIVVTMGSRFGTPGSTNTIFVIEAI